jgi:hypothetical protein
MVQRVYIDTSVIGGCFDEEFKLWSNLLVNEFLSGQKIAIISDITIDEIQDAPLIVINKPDQILKSEYKELIGSDDEVVELAESYILEGAVSKKYYQDALLEIRSPREIVKFEDNE